MSYPLLTDDLSDPITILINERNAALNERDAARRLAEEWRNFAEEIRTAVCGMGDDDWPLLPPPDGLPWEKK